MNNFIDNPQVENMTVKEVVDKFNLAQIESQMLIFKFPNGMAITNNVGDEELLKEIMIDFFQNYEVEKIQFEPVKIATFYIKAIMSPNEMADFWNEVTRRFTKEN